MSKFKHAQPYDSTAAVMQRAMREIGAKRAGAAMGTSPSQTYAYGDGSQALPYDKARALCAAGATAPAEDLAALAGGWFMPLPPPHAQGLAEDAAKVAIGAGEVMAKVIQALADGEVTVAEAEAAIAAIDRMFHTAAPLREKLRRIAEPGT